VRAYVGVSTDIAEARGSLIVAARRSVPGIVVRIRKAEKIVAPMTVSDPPANALPANAGPPESPKQIIASFCGAVPKTAPLPRAPFPVAESKSKANALPAFGRVWPMPLMELVCMARSQ